MVAKEMLQNVGICEYLPTLHNMATKLQTVERLARRQGTVRAQDLVRRGLPTVYLSRLVAQGRLIRHARGVYAPVEQEISEAHDWELACLRVPQGVLCLLSALNFHGIGTQNPFEMWMAIGVKARYPHVDYPPLRVVRFSGAALNRNVIKTRSGGIELRVYDAAKTVADCFKYRNKVGLDVAIEALREGWRANKFTLEQLTEAARICRVGRVIQPYLEMLA
jgi:predicted transcriptional regulator of viral defense system